MICGSKNETEHIFQEDRTLKSSSQGKKKKSERRAKCFIVSRDLLFLEILSELFRHMVTSVFKNFFADVTSVE